MWRTEEGRVMCDVTGDCVKSVKEGADYTASQLRRQYSSCLRVITAITSCRATPEAALHWSLRLPNGSCSVTVLYRRADNSGPVSFTVSAWEWVYATNLSRLQRETSKRHVGEAHSALTTVIQFPQRLSCYWGKIVPLRMLTNLRFADLRLTTAQQRPTGQNLPSDL
jgi:hypothetical protein